jgi:GTP-binding protein
VGRPNVGKSTLFNRLAGVRRAITHSTPGVTRDPISLQVELEKGRLVRLTDTGGFTTDGDTLAQAISRRALDTVQRAAVILLVVDATEMSALDQEFIEQLRPFQERLIVVVNKVDTEERDPLAWEYYSLGVDRVAAVSAAHGRGIDELLDTMADLLGTAPDHAMPDDGGVLRLAVLGQPNTGKSTLVNYLTRVDGSLVSELPGTTRDVLEGEFTWNDNRVVILDTAGIRRKSKVTENVEYYSVTRAIDTVEQAQVVILLIEAEKGLSDQDKKIAQLVVGKGRGIIIGINKWDLLPKIGNQFQAVKDRILFLFPVLAFAPIVPVSARTGSGVPKLMEQVLKVREQLSRRIETGTLNRHLQEWIAKTPPPTRGRHRWKVRYITQVSTLPARFIVFVNRRKDFPDAYIRFIGNQIRADFGLSSIPLKLEVRER